MTQLEELPNFQSNLLLYIVIDNRHMNRAIYSYYIVIDNKHIENKTQSLLRSDIYIK